MAAENRSSRSSGFKSAERSYRPFSSGQARPLFSKIFRAALQRAFIFRYIRSFATRNTIRKRRFEIAISRRWTGWLLLTRKKRCRGEGRERDHCFDRRAVMTLPNCRYDDGQRRRGEGLWTRGTKTPNRTVLGVVRTRRETKGWWFRAGVT